MPHSSTFESILAKAAGLEDECEWLKAIESYEKAAGTLSEQDYAKRAEANAKLGYAYYRAAMQSENRGDFDCRMRHAGSSYREADKFYAKCSGKLEKAKALHCKAMITHLDYWLASTVEEKKRLINESWRFTKETLAAFEEVGTAYEFGRVFNRLSANVDFSFFLEWEYRAREKMIGEAVEYGKKAVAMLLKNPEDECELARAYVKAATYLEVFGVYFSGEKERDVNFKTAADYWRKANDISEQTAMMEMISVQAGPSWDWGEGTDTAIDNFTTALKYARESKDQFKIGCALDFLAYHTCWRAKATEDPDTRAELAKKALRYAEEARFHYLPISFVSPTAGVIWVDSPYADHYWRLASFETDVAKKHVLLEKALEAVPEMLEKAQESGMPDLVNYAHHVFSKILSYLARDEVSVAAKKEFLEQSLTHRNEAIKIIEKLNPFHYWDLGVNQGTMANIRTDLVDVIDEPSEKRNMLQQAILNKEDSIKLSLKWLTLYGQKTGISLLSDLGPRQYQLGDLLTRLYEFTREKERLRDAVRTYEDAAQTYGKINVTSRVAECYWRIAQTFGILADHSAAAKNFDLASNYYGKAAEKVPQLKGLYEDYALYMHAWSETEHARHYHVRQEYGAAREHFENTSKMLECSKKWSFLSPNFSAWAMVDQAEGLSRNEKSDEAHKAFEEAAKLFIQTEESLQTALDKIETPDEKQMTLNMLKATRWRHDYCVARATIEDAKILDKNGDHYESSQKYGAAAEGLGEIACRLEGEEDKKELEYITLISKALQRMTQAEAEALPELYVEASQLFEKAKELSPNEKTKMLMLGHSRFCRALEDATKFSDTRSTAIHASAVEQLESAAEYYMKGGFEEAAEYVRATGLLLDAYAYMDSGKKEDDPAKKARFFMMAERVLQGAAGSYEKAGHVGKKELISRLLEKVRGEKEITLSLTEVLHAPIVSSTTAFPAPTPSFERAVGLEVFQHAEIRGNLIAHEKELKIGEDLELEMELVNAGKGPAVLARIENVIPRGFVLTEISQAYRVEDGCINMKGKRIDPLKTEELKLILCTKARGTFQFKPTIVYFDENGKCKSHEPEPVVITVRELGIKGWLKGGR